MSLREVLVLRGPEPAMVRSKGRYGARLCFAVSSTEASQLKSKSVTCTIDLWAEPKAEPSMR